MEGVGRWQPETQKRGEAEGPKSVLLERDDGAALLLAAREADPCVTRGMVPAGEGVVQEAVGRSAGQQTPRPFCLLIREHSLIFVVVIPEGAPWTVSKGVAVVDLVRAPRRAQDLDD